MFTLSEQTFHQSDGALDTFIHIIFQSSNGGAGRLTSMNAEQVGKWYLFLRSAVPVYGSCPAVMLPSAFGLKIGFLRITILQIVRKISNKQKSSFI